MTKAILKNSNWKRFLASQPDLIDSLWEIIPQPMEIVNIEQIVFTDQLLYHLVYKDKICLSWFHEIDEFIEGDKHDSKGPLDFKFER